MPKSLKEKKTTKLRHEPIADAMEPQHQRKKGSKKPTVARAADLDDDELEEQEDEELAMPQKLGLQIMREAKLQRMEDLPTGRSSHQPPAAQQGAKARAAAAAGSSDEESDEENFEYDDNGEENSGDEGDLVCFDGEYLQASGLTEDEEAVVQRFLSADRQETRTLADIIMEKIREKEEAQEMGESTMDQQPSIPPKVVEVYTAVGKMLQHYKSGKLPKALKMLPHLKNWEDVLWLTRPDQWSPCATYACTRIFSSNLNAKMAQRFFNMVLLEKCRDDIRSNNKLNFHLYMALKKSLFKPASFYKGVLLPLAQSQSCTLREATIIGSVLAKVSVQANHSAAAILRLAEMPYSGSTSMFIKVLLNKKYALPRRVIESLVDHFASFETETRALPVLWHQSMLVFAQRYKFELEDVHKEKLKALLRVQFHHQITPEIRRELFAVPKQPL